LHGALHTTPPNPDSLTGPDQHYHIEVVIVLFKQFPLFKFGFTTTSEVIDTLCL
jgi:hypothetical protein